MTLSVSTDRSAFDGIFGITVELIAIIPKNPTRKSNKKSL